MKSYAVEFLETMLSRIVKYLDEYEKYKEEHRGEIPPMERVHPNGEIWSFSVKVNDFSITGYKEIITIKREIEEALFLLKEINGIKEKVQEAISLLKKHGGTKSS